DPARVDAERSAPFPEEVEFERGRLTGCQHDPSRRQRVAVGVVHDQLAGARAGRKCADAVRGTDHVHTKALPRNQCDQAESRWIGQWIERAPGRGQPDSDDGDDSDSDYKFGDVAEHSTLLLHTVRCGFWKVLKGHPKIS